MQKCLKNAKRRVYEHLGPSNKWWLTPKCWSTPKEYIILFHLKQKKMLLCQPANGARDGM